jgi:hypothetical protein
MGFFNFNKEKVDRKMDEYGLVMAVGAAFVGLYKAARALFEGVNEN